MSQESTPSANLHDLTDQELHRDVKKAGFKKKILDFFTHRSVSGFLILAGGMTAFIAPGLPLVAAVTLVSAGVASVLGGLVLLDHSLGMHETVTQHLAQLKTELASRAYLRRPEAARPMPVLQDRFNANAPAAADTEPSPSSSANFGPKL